MGLEPKLRAASSTFELTCNNDALTAPEAVGTMDNGYLGVDYEKIDVDFTTA